MICWKSTLEILCCSRPAPDFTMWLLFLLEQALMIATWQGRLLSLTGPMARNSPVPRAKVPTNVARVSVVEFLGVTSPMSSTPAVWVKHTLYAPLVTEVIAKQGRSCMSKSAVHLKLVPVQAVPVQAMPVRAVPAQAMPEQQWQSHFWPWSLFVSSHHLWDCWHPYHRLAALHGEVSQLSGFESPFRLVDSTTTDTAEWDALHERLSFIQATLVTRWAACFAVFFVVCSGLIRVVF